MRSEVVLPQPEGPSKVKNEPRSTRRLTSSSATISPKRLPARGELDVGLGNLLILPVQQHVAHGYQSAGRLPSANRSKERP